jgi:hypothetical protein
MPCSAVSIVGYPVMTTIIQSGLACRNCANKFVSIRFALDVQIAHKHINTYAMHAQREIARAELGN